MQDDDRLYGLIAQAEDIQKHAVTLHRAAQEAIKGLPEGYREAIRDSTREILTEAAQNASGGILSACEKVNQSARKMRSTGLVGALIVLSVGIAVSLVAFFTLSWVTSSLRDEAAELRIQVANLKTQAKEFNDKAGKAELSICGEKRRLCVRVDKQVGPFGDDSSYMVILGY